MNLLDAITNWLESDKKDFNTGLEYYQKASHNRSLIMYLQRKRDLLKLTYELQKLLKLMPKRLAEIESWTNIIPKKQQPVNETKVTKDKPKTKKKGTRKKTDKSAVTPKSKMLQFKKIKREDLSPEMQETYDKISEAYKIQRTLHEKMKLAETDELRAGFRADLVKIDDQISAGWDVLDEWTLLQQQPSKETKEVQLPAGEADIARDIIACRSYISRGLDDIEKLEGKKKESRIKEMKERVEKLVSYNASVKKETKQALIKLKIIAKDSLLLDEMPITVNKID